MSFDQLSHDFSDLVDFQPNWNTSSFVRSFAIISLLCCSNHLFERNRYQDIDTYRLQMKFGLRLRESWLTICCAIHKILLFIRIGDGDITPMRSSKWIKVNSIQRLFVYLNFWFRRVWFFWSLSYVKASRSVILTKCTIYPFSYRPLSSMLVLARFLSAVFLNHTCIIYITWADGKSVLLRSQCYSIKNAVLIAYWWCRKIVLKKKSSLTFNWRFLHRCSIGNSKIVRCEIEINITRQDLS